jgi:hypothetical protein
VLSKPILQYNSLSNTQKFELGLLSPKHKQASHTQTKKPNSKYSKSELIPSELLNQQTNRSSNKEHQIENPPKQTPSAQITLKKSHVASLKSSSP